MGQITLFTKDDCSYCVKVKVLLSKLSQSVCDSILNEDSTSNPNISFVELNCSKKPEYMSLCISLSGSLTVPHVFFNTKYMGDANKISCYEQALAGGCTELTNCLRDLALQPGPPDEFLKLPGADVIKVTEGLAFSAQPLPHQYSEIADGGIKTIVNLIRLDSPTFQAQEPEQVKQSGMQYCSNQILLMTSYNLLACLQVLSQYPEPMLIHDETGQRSSVVALLRAAQQMQQANNTSISITTFKEWISGLGGKLPDAWEVEIENTLKAF